MLWLYDNASIDLSKLCDTIHFINVNRRYIIMYYLQPNYVLFAHANLNMY